MPDTSPNLEKALLDFAAWIGLLDHDPSKDDSPYSINWLWFLDPATTVVKSMGGVATRGDFEALVRDLLPDTDPNNSKGTNLGPFPATIPGSSTKWNWKSLQVGGELSVGFAWTTGGDLSLALATCCPNLKIGSQAVDPALIVGLFGIDTGQTDNAKPGFVPDLGHVRVGSQLPPPDFLQSITLGGEINPGKSYRLLLTAKNLTQDMRTLDTTKSLSPWDPVRVALFVIESWIRFKTGGPNPSVFFTRANKHLFPMFGEPPPPPPQKPAIPQFPLFQDVGTQPVDFSSWAKSVIIPNSPGTYAVQTLTELWHLRALLTGDESPSFFPGSALFSLEGPPEAGNPPTQQDASKVQRPQGAYLGVVDNYPDQSGKPAVVLLLQDAHNQVVVPLFGEDGTLPNFAGTVAPGSVSVSLPAPGMAVTGNTITLLSQPLADPPAFAGTYSVQVFATPNNGKVSFALGLPGDKANTPLTIPLPPTKPEAVLGPLAHWLLNAAGTEIKSSAAPVGQVFSALAPFVGAAIVGAQPDPAALVQSVVQAVSQNLSLPIDKYGSVALKWPILTPTLTLSDIQVGHVGTTDVRIGSLKATTDFDVTKPSVTAASLSLGDVRLQQPAGGPDAKGSGPGGPDRLAQKLLPDLTDAPGFSITVAWNGASKPPLQLSGGGRVPVQKNLGPLHVGTLDVTVNTSTIVLGVDLSFELGPIEISVQGLGVKITYSGPSFDPHLDGLAISLDTDVVKLAGAFAKVTDPANPNAPPDYVGGAVVSVVDLFQLSAIGGYTKAVDTATGQEYTSIFVFASLVAPLGGPPYFFVTGIAGGFGYNRTLPPPGSLSDNPFLQVMNGTLQLGGGGPAGELATLSQSFAAADNVNWVAAGIQFVSFGFIHGTAVVAVEFGQEFAFQLLGSASFGIQPLAYFEIDFGTTVDAEKLTFRAGVSPNSYLIDRDLFHLQGDFALGVWFDNADFVLSVGGFHPAFPEPKRYHDAFGDLNRVEVDTILYGFVHFSVQGFFACTNQALMAGASVSLSATFGDIGAGLDAYVDVLMTWDPFHILADLGVSVWFEFLGRHEIGVDLSVWTPEFGGHAHVSIAVVSFDIDFGASENIKQPPTLAQFLTDDLGVPATGGTEDTAQLPRFNTASQAGLLRLDVVAGRAGKPAAPDQSTPQEGLTAGDAIAVGPEFRFRVHSKLPLDTTNVIQSVASSTYNGTLNVPLCTDLPVLKSTFSVKATDLDAKPTQADVPITKGNVSPSLSLRQQYYPKAQFGSLPISALDMALNLDAYSQIGSIDAEHNSILLSSSLEVDWGAKLSPAATPTLSPGANQEESEGSQVYPLPLDLLSGQTPTAHVPGARVALPSLPLVSLVSSQATPPMPIIRPPTLAVARSVGAFGRAPVAARLRGPMLAQPPAGVPVIAPPASPARTADLFGVTLNVTAPHAPAPIGRSGTAPPLVPFGGLTPGAPPSVGTTATLAPGGAVQFRVDEGALKAPRLTTTGNQVVRTVLLSEQDVPLADVYLPAGQGLPLPDQARRVVCVGEGAAGPVAAGGAALEAVGIERNTALLVVSGRTFAAHGCVLTSNAMLDAPPGLLTTVPGYLILQRATALRILFPPVPAGWTLALVAGARVARPGPVTDQIRWVALDAALGPLRTVVGPGRAAFLMTVTAAGPWRLHVELGPEWRLHGVAASDLAVADLAGLYRSTDDWDLIDDRFEQAAAGTSAGLNLEPSP
jgi:hypothetical protein